EHSTRSPFSRSASPSLKLRCSAPARPASSGTSLAGFAQLLGAFLLFDVRAHDRVVRRQVERVARRKRLLQSLVELVFLTLHVTCRSSRRSRSFGGRWDCRSATAGRALPAPGPRSC